MDREKEMLKDKSKPLMWSKQLYVGKLSIDLEPTCIYCDHIKKIQCPINTNTYEQTNYVLRI